VTARDILAPVRAVVEKHRAKAEHDEAIREEREDFYALRPRPPLPYSIRHSCTCNERFEHSADEGNEPQRVWTNRCELANEEA
jgi:hypothetical protein